MLLWQVLGVGTAIALWVPSPWRFRLLLALIIAALHI
jgi:hypothetical protein